MRIKSVRLAWFRGAADPVALDADCKSMVVYGQNGAGKSSFVDAVEYIINNGKLAHLTHEYSGRNQEKAVLNTHTPGDQETELWVKFQNDAELNIKIAPNGTYAKAGAEAIAMDTWAYRRTILRQDEVAEFIRSRKGEKYSALLPLFGLHELEVAAENLRQLARVVEQQSELGQKQGAFNQIAVIRTQFFGDDSNEAVEKKVEALHKKYCPDSKSTEAQARCTELETTFTERVSELSRENQRHLALRAIAGTDIAGAVEAVQGANAALAGSVDPLIAEKLEVLQSADAFAEKLEDEGDVACPACGQSFPAGKFKAHVKAEQERLQEIIVVFEQRRASINTLIDVLKTIKTTLAKAEIKEWRDELNEGPLKGHVGWIEQCDADGFRQTLSEDNIKDIKDNGPSIIKVADEASQDAPPDIKDLVKNRALIEAAKAVFEAKELAEKISKIEKLIAFINSVETGVREEIRERSEEVINEISGDMGTMWKTLHPWEPIEDVRLYLPEDDKAIDIALKFHGKDQDSPRLTLSEGYRNSLGLCIFLAMAKRETDSDRPLFLDDVVISLDRNHRGMIAQLLEDEFAKRQVIVFTHDRAWYAELRQQLVDKRWTFKTLLPYETPSLGIRWSHKTMTFDDARAFLKERPDSAGNDARKIMDVELSFVAERLQIRFPYLRGDRNDMRMAHDFLTRLVADGKKCFQKKKGDDFPCHADALDLLETADRFLVSWGNKGSHSFDVMRPEATKLIDACEQALEAFICKKCNTPLWLADAGNREWVQCQCGQLRWRYGKG